MSSNVQIEYTKKEIPKKVQSIGLALFAFGLVLVIAGYLTDSTRTSFNNIIALMFLTSIGVGSLFLVAIEYLGGAVWSVPFRRSAEFFTAVIFVLPIVLIPLLFNIGHLFHWMHPEVVEADKILRDKAPYLNTNFFIIRALFFLLIWTLFAFLLIRNSTKQDKSGDQLLTKSNIKISAIFIPFFAITITFTSIDWMMSLEPHWFSTIFGVYYFSGTVLASLAAVTIAGVLLNKNGFLVKGIKEDHFYSLGALLFAFTNFWAYIAFSQFMLIWYANLPEETVWFLARWEGSWKVVSVGIIFIRFAVPYFALLSQPSKMNPNRLLFASAWILFAHLYDIYWLVMPTFSKTGAVFGWIEIGFPLLVVGLIIIVFVNRANKFNAIPIGDPKLKRGIDFKL